MKNTDPLLGAKLKSKTHLQNTFFDFLSRFLRIWLQSLKKELIWPKNFFFFLDQKRCQKTQNFTLISNSLKKLLKNAPKKVISKTCLTNMSKSEKSAYFRHVFANNFFFVRFFKTFSTDSKFCVFWHLSWFKKKKILGHISTFFKLWLQMRRKWLKIRKIFFYECVLEFNYATIKGLA